MIDQQLKEHVTTQVNAVKSAQGDYADVIRRGKRRRRTTLGLQAAAVFLLFVGLVGIATQLPTERVADESPEANADLQVTVNRGDGPGAFAEELAERVGPRVVEGSANHIGWVETPQGRFDLVTFTAVGEDPRRSDSELSTCAGALAAATSDNPRFSTGACSRSGEIPVLEGSYGRDGFFYVLEQMPADTVRVVIATTEGRTIEVTTDDYAFATWPLPWGAPESLTAYDREDSQTGSITYLDSE